MIVEVISQPTSVVVGNEVVEVTLAPPVVQLVTIGVQGPAGTIEGLDDVYGVTLTDPQEGERLEYDGVSQVWRNRGNEKSPLFTYTGGLLTRVDYESGNYKTFTYADGQLSQSQYIRFGVTITKVFNYNLDGSLASITETES